MTYEKAIAIMKHPARYTLEERAEADKLALEAMEKQIKKKPSCHSVRYGIAEEYTTEYTCKNCGRFVGDEYDKEEYCSHCGTPVDWSDA